MHIPQLLQHTLTILLSYSAAVLAADTKPSANPCTIYSSTTGSTYDLRPLQLIPIPYDLDPKSKPPSGGTNESYHARGYDYASNFTLNFCAPVVESLKDVEGLPRAQWANVSAYYKDKTGDIYSIGTANDIPTFRGKKLLLNYTLGSPCPDLDEDGYPIRTSKSAIETRKEKPATRRKNTMLSFICDTSPLLSSRPSIAFIGSPDHCTYIFEVRSRWACAGATPTAETGTLGPAGVFAVILGIAIAVYVVGGIVYQRNVMHQRGWRQLPNYGVWAGLFGFFQDMFTILFSSCTRCMPSLGRLFGGKHGGYHRVGTDYRSNGSVGRGGAGGRTPEDENRLIDSLDEEWD